MKKAFTIISIVAVLGFVVLIGIPALFYGIPRIFSPSETASCTSLNKDEAVNTIRADFLERLPTWKTDSESLQTSSPKLNFSAPSTQKGVISVEFLATSDKSKIQYFATMDCKYGNIEYSSNKIE